MGSAVLWLRRDLRRHDHPALHSAADRGTVAPLFVIDPDLWNSVGAVRRGWIAASVLAARAHYDGALSVRLGPPSVVVPQFANEVGAASVHVTRETTPLGRLRDTRVSQALNGSGVDAVATASPYAVTPGTVRTAAGSPFKVFTAFARAWRAVGFAPPLDEPNGLRLHGDRSDPDALALLHTAVAECPIALPPAGETAALDRWTAFTNGALEQYDVDRDRPDIDGTSGLSAQLKVGSIHPRRLLADLAARSGVEIRADVDRFVTELAWREFYADVLWHHPDSARNDLRPELATLDYDPDSAAVDAWRAGQTGFPIVDAGMRQLLATGWMHNRVRMITASFLCKDLHVHWSIGADHFLHHLIDGDVASNSNGWQWVAGTGTDAAPYFRVFNPVLQGTKFDPDGDYVRRWIPELRHVPGTAAHTPWTAADGAACGYPERIVDHAAERSEALRRYAAARAANPNGRPATTRTESNR
jgi:deoxyribodipyrimidine photo-lyase